MYDKKFRQKCVDECLVGDKTIKEVADKYGVAYDTIKSWVFRFTHNGNVNKDEVYNAKKFKKIIEASDFKDKTEDELRIENIKLQIENERLKKKYLVRINPITGQKEYGTGSEKNTK